MEPAKKASDAETEVCCSLSIFPERANEAIKEEVAPAKKGGKKAATASTEVKNPSITKRRC